MAVFTIGGKSVMKKKSDYRLLLQRVVRESSDVSIVGHIDQLHKHDWRKPTSEYDATCKHEWRMLSREDREQYGSAIAKCLEKWEECKFCNKVRYVGNRNMVDPPDYTLPTLTPLSELDLDEVLGEGRR